ncbi:MAG TPA: protein translocase subunit SecF [Gammaproteobacteria bacterium]|nr:protein translocase subunit SecF [Gammaproteobacteria bacterium]
MNSTAKTENRAGFDIMGRRRLAMVLSLILMAVSLGSLFTRGLSLGLDFTGGYLIEVGYESPVNLADVRRALVDNDFDDALVQNFGSASDVLVRLAPREGVNSAALSQQVLDILQTTSSEAVSMRRVEFVGPQVGEELREQGGLAMLYALVGIVIYIWLRFEKKFSVGSVAALVHDVVITLGIFSITQMEFDLTVLAALLAVIGYSLNDTIVVFDRIRENFRKLRKGTPEEVINISINQTLSRTLITSLTTLLVLLALFLFGGKVIGGFAMALIVGVVVGTYSSIYIASSGVLALGISKQDLIPIEKEGDELDDLP